MHGLKVIIPNISWKISPNSDLNIWNSRWIDGEAPPRVTRFGFAPPSSMCEFKIKDLILPSLKWNNDLINELFPESWGKKIKAIPICPSIKKDYLFWAQSNSGEYTTKNGYAYNLNIFLDKYGKEKDRVRINNMGRKFCKSNLWRLRIPERWKILLWKIITQSLPVGAEFKRRNITTNWSCPFCNSPETLETTAHLFRDCEVTRRLWAGCSLGIRAECNISIPIEDWIINWIKYLDVKDAKGQSSITFISIIWATWHLRCPLHLPDPLFPAVKSSCTGHHPGQLPNHAQCCPVLASWLYSAYSTTALGTNTNTKGDDNDRKTTSLEMPDLPDDSETCVDALENVMRDKGLNLVRPNETCDVVYCYCGIRLHPLSCSTAFRVSDKGEIVGDSRVDSLQRHCLSNSTGTGSHGTRNRLARCSKCLHSLYSLKKSRSGSGNGTRSEGRTEKMRGRDCELMGLTWLLNKDRDAYMSTVTSVMRVLMLNPDSPDPLSCSLSSDGMPLAVDSNEIDGQSSSVALNFSPYLCICLFVPLIMYLSCYF
ncbi:hypothetical protein KSS87_000756 [Heliosperma pusillum]|nr:hypothetical protein KSS87_000756 [Heliosperma pusillum]